MTNFPLSPDLSSCADLGAGCFKAAVKTGFGWDAYLPGKEVSDRSAHFPVDSPLCTVLRIWKEFLLAPSLSGLLSVGLSVGLVFSFCGGCGHREAKGKDFHLLPLMNFSVPLCASPHAEGRWNLHLSQL